MPENGETTDSNGFSPDSNRTLLRNMIRRKIIDLLAGAPGMNKHQIAKALGIHLNSVIFHVKRLVDVGLLESRAGWNGRQTHFFTPELAHLWEEEATRVLYGRAPVRLVALYLADNPGTHSHEIAEVLGMSPRTVREHLRILREGGLAEGVQVEQRIEYYADELLVTWAQEVAGDCARDWMKFDDGDD